jgi:hypothetical protein
MVDMRAGPMFRPAWCGACFNIGLTNDRGLEKGSAIGSEIIVARTRTSLTIAIAAPCRSAIAVLVRSRGRNAAAGGKGRRFVGYTALKPRQASMSICETIRRTVRTTPSDRLAAV